MKLRLIVTAIISSFILGATPNSFAADTQAPVLVDWKIVDAKIDIANGPAIARINFSVSDESELVPTPRVETKSLITNQKITTWAKFVKKLENISFWEVEIQFVADHSPGLWRSGLYPLRDLDGNTNTDFSLYPKWQVEIMVYDKKFTEAGEAAISAEIAKAEVAEALAKVAALAKAKLDANRKIQIIRISPNIWNSVNLTKSRLPIKIDSTSNLVIFAYNSTNEVCEYLDGYIATKSPGRCVIAFSQEGDAEYKPANNLILEFNVLPVDNKKTTITCIKGKLTKKVTALKPKCPAGYKKK